MLWIVLLWGFCSLFFSKIPNKPPPGTIFRKRFGRFFLRKSSNMNTTTTTPCCNSAAVVHRYLLLVSVITEKSERLHTYQYMNIHGLYKNRCQVLVHNNNYTGVWFWSPHFTTTVYQVLPFRRKKKKNHGFLTAKNTACGVRFLLRFNMYLFLDQCDEVLHLFSAFVLN